MLVEERQRSIVSACQIARCSRTADYCHDTPATDPDAPIIAALTMLIAQEVRWGLRKCCNRLRALGHRWNHML